MLHCRQEAIMDPDGHSCVLHDRVFRSFNLGPHLQRIRCRANARTSIVFSSSRSILYGLLESRESSPPQVWLGISRRQASLMIMSRFATGLDYRLHALQASNHTVDRLGSPYRLHSPSLAPPQVRPRNRTHCMYHLLTHGISTSLFHRRGLCHVFAGAAIMELPTFVLALSMLVPALRSDMVFTSLFFVTRIVYHAVLRELPSLCDHSIRDQLLMTG